MANVVQAIWDRAAADPDRVALRGAHAPWTYGRLRERASAVATRLAEAGVVPGDRVLLAAPSVPEFAGAYYGILGAGAVAVTASTMSTRAELEYLGRDAGVSLVLGWCAVQPAPAEAAEALGAAYWGLATGLESFSSAPRTPAVHGAGDDDTAVILYTSGTTGRPKGAQLTHGNLIASATSIAQVLEARRDDRFGTALPLFHVFGQAAIMGTALRTGASLSLLERFDADALLSLLRRDRLTVMAGVPTMWHAMLHADGPAGDAGFAALRLAISGGASLPAEILRAFEARFGCVILEGYALSETTAAGTFTTLHRPRKPGSAGAAVPGCEIAVRGADGDEVGEILMRGPMVMKGYWNRPESTAEVLSADGWLATGDLGSIDADGDLTIVDRKKDLVIHGGYNVYPREVEDALYEHPDIREVAVIGVPDAHYGEEVAAVIALRPGAGFDARSMREWAKVRLSAYKAPRLFHVVDALPKGPTGKVLKREIDRRVVRAEARVAR